MVPDLIDNSVSDRFEGDIEAPTTSTSRDGQNDESTPSPETANTLPQVSVVTATQPNTRTLTHPMILTPSRLRIDSRVLVAHTSTQWLMNMVFAILIQVKVGRQFVCENSEKSTPCDGIPSEMVFIISVSQPRTSPTSYLLAAGWTLPGHLLVGYLHSHMDQQCMPSGPECSIAIGNGMLTPFH
jgi:hypothetical protein